MFKILFILYCHGDASKQGEIVIFFISVITSDGHLSTAPPKVQHKMFHKSRVYVA